MRDSGERPESLIFIVCISPRVQPGILQNESLTSRTFPSKFTQLNKAIIGYQVRPIFDLYDGYGKRAGLNKSSAIRLGI